MILRILRLSAVLCISLCSLWLDSSALAQTPEIAGLLPSGGPRGQVTRVEIAGKNLAGARIHLAGAGISVKSAQVNPVGDLLTAEIMVEADAHLGPHEIRISAPKGPSNGARFFVDLYPNLVTSGQRKDSDPPIPIDRTAPIVINGRIAEKAGRDQFLVTAEAGETWVFDCGAARIRSRFDPVIEIRDESRTTLKLVQSTWENDPRFPYTFAKSGKYLITVRDSEYLGGVNFTYRLLVGRLPFISGFIPRGERPGRRVGLLVGGPNIDPRTLAIATIPADETPGERWAKVSLRPGGDIALPLLVDPTPVYGITETDANMALPELPVVLDGAFLRVPQIKFFFHGSPGERFEFDLLGRRIGSRIDGALQVTDSSGKQLAENDDAIGKDSRLEFTPPTDGMYTLEARNVEEKVGPDCHYRLMARRVEPDFKIEIRTDRIQIGSGGTVVIPVTAERIGGFTGPIELKADGLPPGARFSGGIIGPSNKTDVTFTAAESAPVAGPIRILGEAVVQGRPTSREAVAWEQYEHRSIDLLLSVEYSYARPHHLWDILLLATTDQPVPFSIQAATESFTLAPGGKTEITVKAIRRGTANGEIKLELRNLPEKVTASAASIPAGQAEAKITLTAAVDAPVNTTNLIVQGKLDKSTEIAPAIRIAVAKN